MTEMKDSVPRAAREALTGRITRGLDLYCDRCAEIEKIDEGLYRVPSANVDGKRGPYTVCIQFARESCTCRDFKVRRVACKHIYAALVAEPASATRFPSEAGTQDSWTWKPGVV